MKQSGKIAFGGVLGALALVVMLMTVIPTATYALPAIAGALFIPLVVEWGSKMGLTVYAAVAILSLIISPDKEAAFLFVAFFGHYPIVKALLERHVSKEPLRWLCKLAVFNACVVAAYGLMIWAFKMPMDEFELFGVSVPWLLLGFGNIVFVLYDIALTRVITLYVYRLREHLIRIIRR